MNIKLYENALAAAHAGGMGNDEAHEFAVDQATRDSGNPPTPPPFVETWMTRPLPMNNGAEGKLCYATYQPLPCGCCVTGDGSLTFPLTVSQCAMHKSAPALHAFAEDMLGYLEMKLAGFRQDYPEDHCIVQTCLRKLAAARHALGFKLDHADISRVAAELLTHTEQ